MPDPGKLFELDHSIRRILLEEWDPVGIRSVITTDYESVKDEYDRYIGRIKELIYEGTSIEAIEKFLLWAEKQQVPGIRPSERNANAARLLFELRVR